MAPIFTRAAKPLVGQLKAKSDELRAKEASKNEAADALAIASSNAAFDAVEAARLATAVEDAIDILDKAGVTL